MDVEDPSYDGVPTVVVHLDAEPASAPDDGEPELPVVAVTVDPHDDKEGS